MKFNNKGHYVRKADKFQKNKKISVLPGGILKQNGTSISEPPVKSLTEAGRCFYNALTTLKTFGRCSDRALTTLKTLGRPFDRALTTLKTFGRCFDRALTTLKTFGRSFDRALQT